MGNGQSKVNVLGISLTSLQKHLSIQPTSYVQPFRQFSSEYHKKSSSSQHQSVVKIKAPQQEQIFSLSQPKFRDIQQAYQQKTKNFQIQSIVFDQYYTDRFMYIVKDLEQVKTLLIRDFQTYQSHTFANIVCEVSINEEILKLQNKNLLKLSQNYLIQNQDIKFENPKTQVLEFEQIAASLAQIIKYRRQNNWEWTQIQFNQLAYDLTSGLSALHQANITHNDIRPQNIFYSLTKKCYLIGQFSYATKNGVKGNLRSNRASKNYMAPQANSNQQYDFKKADVYSMGITLLCAFYLCNPINVQQASHYNNKFRGISGFKLTDQMMRPDNQRKPIQLLLKSLSNPNYQNQLMENLIKSLRFKIKPKNQNQKIYTYASSFFYKRLGLWEDWRDQVNQILQSDHNISKFQMAELYKQHALIDFCQDELDESTMNAKKAAKLYRQMGQEALNQGNLNLALKEYKSAVQCSKFYVNRNDLDLAKSLICLSKVHAQKRQEHLSQTLLSQAKELIIKQSSQDSILYSEMKIKQGELAKKFFRYQQSLDDLQEALSVARKMEPINLKSSKLCQAKIMTLVAQNQILLSKKQHLPQKTSTRLQRAEQYLNNSKNIYENLLQVDCHLELAQNTEVLGLLNLEKEQFSDAKLCFQKSYEMRKQYQETKMQAPYIAEHGTTLSNLGKCERLMNKQKTQEIYLSALKHQQEALEIYRKIYGSDHNYYSACVLKQMGQLYNSMELYSKSKLCTQCSRQILKDLYGDDFPFNQIGDIQKMLRN